MDRRVFVKRTVATGALLAWDTILPWRMIFAHNPAQKLNGNKTINPYGIAVGSSGRIFVTDAGGYCIYVLSSTGEIFERFGSPGGGGGKLNFPQGIALDDQGRIYVVDSNNGRVAVFDDAGRLLHSFGEVGGTPGSFFSPRGISLLPDGTICVADYRNHRIQLLDSSGNCRQTIGSLGDDPAELPVGSQRIHLRLPTAVAYNEKLRRFYIVDSKHGRVRVVSRDGGFLFDFGSSTDGNIKLNLPEGIALDNKGNVYVADTMNHRVQVFDSEGKYSRTIAQEIERPTSLAIDSGKHLLVVDAGKRSVLAFEI
jgi:DNA-binding beta-propeller fold protein YncE